MSSVRVLVGTRKGAFILTAIIIVVTLVQGRIFGFGRSTAA